MVEYNQYGDVILTNQEERQLEQFKNFYQAGWDLQTSDPEDQVQEDEFMTSYIIHFKQKNDKQYALKQEAKARQQNFMQKLVKKIINKGKQNN